MTNSHRHAEITHLAYQFLVDLNINSIPVDVFEVCKTLNIELVPLSRLLRNGFTEQEIYDVWNNDDGTFNAWKDKKTNEYRFTIAYNDYKNIGRVRFTIAEELGHYILKHYLKDNYNINNAHGDYAEYKIDDYEAKFCAGTILIPPPVYYCIPSNLWTFDIMEKCFDITNECAQVREQIYAQRMYMFTNDSLYKKISSIFNQVILYLANNAIPPSIASYYKSYSIESFQRKLPIREASFQSIGAVLDLLFSDLNNFGFAPRRTSPKDIPF